MDNPILNSVLLILFIISVPILFKRKMNGELSLFGKPRQNNSMLSYDELEKRRKGAQQIPSTERNGNKNDVLDLITAIMRIARKKSMYVIAPAAVTYQGKQGALSLVFITPSGITGVRCYGYGGTIRKTPSGWKQVLNGIENEIPDPQADQMIQRNILCSVLKAENLDESSVTTLTVYTTPGVKLVDVVDTNCYTSDNFLTLLNSDVLYKKHIYDPQSLGKSIATILKKNK